MATRAVKKGTKACAPNAPAQNAPAQNAPAQNAPPLLAPSTKNTKSSVPERSTPHSHSDADIDRSIMAMFGAEFDSDGKEETMCGIDEQREFLAANTSRLDSNSQCQIYSIAYLQGCAAMFISQKPGILALNLRKVPDDIIHQMYLRMSVILNEMKTVDV